MLNTQEKLRLKKHVSLDNQRVTEVFDALSDPNRCQLFRLVAKRRDLNVGEAASVLDVSVPLASQHLKILESHRLLSRQKRGREVFYSANTADPLVRAIIQVILS